MNQHSMNQNLTIILIMVSPLVFIVWGVLEARRSISIVCICSRVNVRWMQLDNGSVFQEFLHLLPADQHSPFQAIEHVIEWTVDRESVSEAKTSAFILSAVHFTINY